MRAEQGDYLKLLQGLMPAGVAWTDEPDAILTLLLAGLAEDLTRGHNRGADARDESDPRSTLEMLPDWERVTGLPDECTLDADTLQERRAAVVAKLRSTGGQSVAYFRDLAESLGCQVVIEEFKPFICGISRCGDVLNGGHEVRLHWRVRVLGPRVTYFRCGASRAGDKLLKISIAEDLECQLRQRSPAHTELIVSYQEV